MTLYWFGIAPTILIIAPIYNRGISYERGVFMDKNLLGMYDLKIERLKKALERNNMTCNVFNTEEELHDYFKTIFKDQKVVAVGGSMSFDEMHVLDLVGASDAKFLDRYAKGLTKEEINAIHHEASNADIYLTSTNAMTTDGCLYNIDGNGNRVAAMIYGPKDVYVVAGVNKIFESEEEAIDHIKNVSAPANAIRLHRQTGCAVAGKCVNCMSDQRICASYVKLAHQGNKDRIHVIIMRQELGY